MTCKLLYFTTSESHGGAEAASSINIKVSNFYFAIHACFCELRNKNYIILSKSVCFLQSMACLSMIELSSIVNFYRAHKSEIFCAFSLVVRISGAWPFAKHKAHIVFQCTTKS